MVHRFGVASRKIYPTTASEKQGVSGHQVTRLVRLFNEEALRSRRVSGGMNESNRNAAQFDRVTGFVGNQLALRDAGHLRRPWSFELVHMDRSRIEFEELIQPGDLVPEQAAADVVLVVMGCERAHDRHVVRLGHVEQARDVPSGVDDHRFSGRTTPDEIDKVGHVPGLNLTKVKIGSVGHAVVPYAFELECSFSVSQYNGVYGSGLEIVF